MKKQQLQQQIAETQPSVFDKGLEQGNLHTWFFGILPISYKQERDGYDVKAYPAHKKYSVATRLFGTESQKYQVM